MSVEIPESVDLAANIPPKVTPFGFYGDLLTEGVWLPTKVENGIEPKAFVAKVKEGRPVELVDFEGEEKLDGYELSGTFPSAETATYLMRKETIQFLKDGASIDPKETDRKLSAALEKHVFLKDPGVRVVVKRLIEGTYFYDMFDHFPIIFIFGVSESGKSRLLKVVLFTGYHGKAMIDPTEAALFRTKEEERTTTCIDEADQFRNPKNPAYQMITTLLNASYSKYFTVPRYDEVNKEKKRIRRDFSLYSPLAMSSTESLWGITLSRAIQIVSYRVAKDYPEPHPESFAKIRDEMYYHRLTRAFEVRDAYAKTEAPLTGRYSELFRPLFVLTQIFGQEGETTALTEFAKNYEETMRIEAVNITQEEGIISILLEAIGQRDGPTEEWLPIKDMISKAEARGHEFKPKSVSNVLTKLGLDRRKRLARGMSFAYSPGQVRDIAARLGLLVKKEDAISEGGVGSEENLGRLDGSDIQGNVPRNSSLSTSTSPSTQTDGICEYCGKAGDGRLTREGHFVCNKCLREAGQS